MQNEPLRDLENERKELLLLIKSEVSPEIISAIEIANSVTTISKRIEVKISHQGANNAH